MTSPGTEPTHTQPSHTQPSRIEPLPLPPYSPDLLADLHAGVLSESMSAALWPLVRRDPDAVHVLTALDAVTARLAASGRELAKGESIPPGVAERIDRALAAAEYPLSAESDPEQSAPEQDVLPVTSLVTRRRVPRMLTVVGVAAAVAIALSITTAVLNGRSPQTDTSPDTVAAAPQPTTDPPALVVDSGRLDDSTVRAVMADRGTTSLVDSGELSDCLEANGFDRSSAVLGAADVELDGRSGVMFVVAGPDAASGVTLVAVGADCGAGNPATLVLRSIG